MDINLELRRYAASFVYFLLKRLEKIWLEKINSIILFGSVAQERAGIDSDIDLFIDTTISKSQIRKLRSKIQKEKEEFLLTNEALSYKAKGIYSEVNIIIGNLSSWHEMKKSVSSSGIVMYGPYITRFKKGMLHHSIIFFWEGEGKRRGAFLNKLYGYRVKGKRYEGTIQRFSGTKVGKAAAIIPIEHRKDFTKILESYKINYKVIEVFV